MRSLLRVYVLGTLSVYISFSGIRAQGGYSNVTCTRSFWEYNSLDQSPCLVWGQLQSLCIPGVIVTPLLNTGYQYYPPSLSGAIDDCNCNVVSYNLMAACSWCQTDIISTNWVTESTWEQGCTTYDSTGTDVDISNITIPSWAYLSNNGATWNPATAQAVVTSTPSISVPSPTSSSTSSSSTGTASTSSSSSTQTPVGTNNSSSTPVSAIAGGVVGGVAVFAIAASLLFLYFRRRHRRTQERATSPVDLVSVTPTPYYLSNDGPPRWQGGNTPAPIQAPQHMQSSSGYSAGAPTSQLATTSHVPNSTQPLSKSTSLAYSSIAPDRGQTMSLTGLPPYEPSGSH